MSDHGHELTDEQGEIRALAARFADEVVAPRAGEWDREHRFPREVFDQLGELGLMGVCVPEELAGAGADYLSYVLVLEELSRADAGVGVTLAVHTGAGTLPLVARADEDDRLTGTKQWITNGSYAHTFLVFARDARAAGRPSAFVVRRGAPGFR